MKKVWVKITPYSLIFSQTQTQTRNPCYKKIWQVHVQKISWAQKNTCNINSTFSSKKPSIKKTRPIFLRLYFCSHSVRRKYVFYSKFPRYIFEPNIKIFMPEACNFIMATRANKSLKDWCWFSISAYGVRIQWQKYSMTKTFDM